MGGTTVEVNSVYQQATTPTSAGHLGNHFMLDGVSTADYRCNESLGDWLRKVGYGSWIVKFQKNGIQSVSDLVECELTEENLRDDIGMKEIMTRRRLLSHLDSITGHVNLRGRDSFEQAARQIRDGLVGHRDVALSKRVPHHVVIKDVPMPK